MEVADEVTSGSSVRGGTVHAKVGDRIIIKGHHIGEPDRDGEIIGVGPDGGPPFTVRWEDSGHEALFFPGTDAFVQHFHFEPTASPQSPT